MNTLVLSSDYRPLGVISWEKAIVLAFKGRAEIIEEYADKVVRSVSQTFKMPAVIKLIRYVGKIVKSLRYKKEHVWLRDKGTCMYCGDKIPLKEATLDHVKPKSQGGKTEWTNIVTACKDCNLYKDDFSLEEVGMKLIKVPVKPSNLSMDFTFLISLLFSNKKVPEEWKPWIGDSK